MFVPQRGRAEEPIGGSAATRLSCRNTKHFLGLSPARLSAPEPGFWGDFPRKQGATVVVVGAAASTRGMVFRQSHLFFEVSLTVSGDRLVPPAVLMSIPAQQQ